MAGRPALSAEHHALRGTKATRPSRARSDAGEEQVAAGRPKMPKTFSPLEVECWKSAVKILKSRGVLSRGDSEALELWARTKARYIRASQALEKEGDIVTETRFSKSGDEYEVRVQNPNLKIVEKCLTHLQSMARALGLNPIDRTKIKKTKPSEESLRAVVTYASGSVGAACPDAFSGKRQLPC
jgi:P27 family predicted phage terminase small subunit